MKVTTVVPWLEHNERKQGVTTVVLHHTAGASAMSTIAYLRGPWSALKNRFLGRSASYHYIIERDGMIYKCVPTSKRAWHAGRSNGPDGSDVNSYSVGIAFANRGDGEDYTLAQVRACEELIAALYVQFPRLKWLTTHRLITKRKIDPAYFAFHHFAKAIPRLTIWRDASLGRGWNG